MEWTFTYQGFTIICFCYLDLGRLYELHMICYLRLRTRSRKSTSRVHMLLFENEGCCCEAILSCCPRRQLHQ
jgi:hypothetical protein